MNKYSAIRWITIPLLYVALILVVLFSFIVMLAITIIIPLIIPILAISKGVISCIRNVKKC